MNAFEKKLRESGCKITAQRQAIFEYISQSKEHPSAATIYNALKCRFSTMSLNTVYNTLSLLAELGLITKLFQHDESAHFDKNPLFHAHLICLGCKNIFDLPEENNFRFKVAGAARKKIEETYHFKTLEQQTFLYGYCSKCQKNIKEE